VQVHPARPWILPTEPTRRSDLIRLGITSRMIRTGLAMGTLVRVRQGVVVGTEFWPTDPAGQHLVRARAELAANPGAVLSHQSAALAWGLPTPGFSPWTDLPVSVTLPPSGHSSHTVHAVHHLLSLPPGQVQRDRLGYDVTSPARTAVDLAAGLELPAALAILDGAARVICASMVPSIRRRDYSNPRLVRAAVELLEVAAESARAARLTQALGLVCPARESAPESVSAGHIFLAGLPMPKFQVELKTPLGTYFADFLWEEQRLIGECDGAMKYDDPQAYVKEKRREQVLRDLEFGFVRWEATESVLRPDRMLGRIERALGQ
jgi:Protein of unknown function (DUF559).